MTRVRMGDMRSYGSDDDRNVYIVLRRAVRARAGFFTCYLFGYGQVNWWESIVESNELISSGEDDA